MSRHALTKMYSKYSLKEFKVSLIDKIKSRLRNEIDVAAKNVSTSFNIFDAIDFFGERDKKDTTAKHNNNNEGIGMCNSCDKALRKVTNFCKKTTLFQSKGII